MPLYVDRCSPVSGYFPVTRIAAGVCKVVFHLLAAIGPKKGYTEMHELNIIFLA